MLLKDRSAIWRRMLPLTLGAVLAAAALGSSVASAEPVSPASVVSPGPVTQFGGPADMQSVLQPPAGLDDAVAVAASDVPGSYSNLALRANGTVVGWGLNPYGEASVPADLHNVVAISTGAGFSVALGSDGSLTTWGVDDSGQLDVPGDLGPVSAVAAGGYLGYRGYGVPYAACGFALALRDDGTVVRWGENRDGSGCDQLDSRLDPPAGLTDVVAITAGDRTALALKSDGTVVAWGPGNDSRLDGTPPARWSNVVAVSAGAGNMLGLRSDGTVLAYGIWGEAGAPSISGVKAISAGHVDLFVHTDGMISAYQPVYISSVPTDSGYQTVSAGSSYGLAIGAPSNSAPTVPLGSDAVQPRVDTNPAGSAEAFQYTAVRDATVSTAHVYLDARNAANTVLIGVYADRNGEPGRLLSTGVIRNAANGEWNSTSIAPLVLRSEQAYWLALLGPTHQGIIAFRDQPDGTGGPTRLSAQTSLSETWGLPRYWRSSTEFANSPASAYLD